MDEHRFRFHGDLCLRLTLLPCGLVEREDLNQLVSALSENGMQVTIARERPTPLGAFNSQRRQYRADDFLVIARKQPGERVLVVTNCDLYAERSQFCFRLSRIVRKVRGDFIIPAPYRCHRTRVSPPGGERSGSRDRPYVWPGTLRQAELRDVFQQKRDELV